MHKCVKIGAIGPVKNEFSNGIVEKKTKTRGAGKCKSMSKKGVKRSHKSVKNGPWSSTKTMPKNIPPKIKKCSKHDSTISPKK